MYDCKLALMTGVDIPIPELQMTLHQPTIKEISYLGEQDFFIAAQLLCINKNMYLEDKNLLNDTSNFQIFMTMMNEKTMIEKKDSVLQVLTLLFPGRQVIATPNGLMLKQDQSIINIDESNFEALQKVLEVVFCLKNSGQQNFNPVNKKAKEIADKLMKARQRVAAQQATTSGSMFGQYLSIITVGLGSMSLKDALELTMYQLYDLVERYSLYVNWDLDIRSRLAGAKGDKPVESWMKQIH